MAVTKDKPTPYAPPSAILELIGRYRSRGLPAPVTAEVLGRSGIADSLIPRTLQALQSLDLIDKKGQPTETLEGIRLAPEADYKQRLEEWLNAAYADVLTYVDPSEGNETKVRDAFRNYQPVGQQSRMVTLFLGLYAAAGVAPEKKTQPRQPRRSSATSYPLAKPSVRKKPPVASDIPAPLAGLLSSLPPQGQGWTQTEREKFINTFGAVLDFCFPITENNAPHANQDDEEDSET